MAYLTTAKIANSIQDLKGALSGGLLNLFETLYSNSFTKNLYDGTLGSNDYTQSIWDFHDKKVYESRGTLAPAPDFGYKADSLYYLVGPFKDRQADRTLHLRFENPGSEEITDFHLTDEGGLAGIQYQIPHSTQSYWMRGHLFFSVNGGKISFCKVGGPRGSSNKQMSDARLMSYVPDVTAIVYYWMYRIT
jgi:hypothetical protein